MRTPSQHLAALAFLAAISSGCQRVRDLLDPGEPDTLHYLVYLPLGFEGAHLVVDGEDVGELRLDQQTVYRDRPSVKLKLPSKKTFADGLEVALRVPTPCGNKDYPLGKYRSSTSISPGMPRLSASGEVRDMDNKVVEGDRGTASEERLQRKRSDEARPVEIQLMPEGKVEMPSPTTLWLDDPGAKKKLKVGELVIANAPDQVLYGDKTTAETGAIVGRKVRLWDLGCKPELALEVDGRSLGSFKDDGKPGGSVIVTQDKAACYKGTQVLYSSDVASSAGPERYFILRDAHAHHIGWSQIDHFLSAAPSSVKGSFASRTELLRTPCPANEDEGQKKTKKKR